MGQWGETVHRQKQVLISQTGQLYFSDGENRSVGNKKRGFHNKLSRVKIAVKTHCELIFIKNTKCATLLELCVSGTESSTSNSYLYNLPINNTYLTPTLCLVPPWDMDLAEMH